MWLQFNLFIKRLFDICSSTCAIVVLLPVWVVIGIWIKTDSKGPIDSGAFNCPIQNVEIPFNGSECREHGFWVVQL